MRAHARAYAPGRVCLIGEHTDYNDGLALAFAIAQGVTVRADAIPSDRGDPDARGDSSDHGHPRPHGDLSSPGDPDARGDSGGRGDPSSRGHPGDEGRVIAEALDFGERDEFPLAAPPPASGWRAFVRGTVSELTRAGLAPPAASLQITGDVPRGAGMSSSAALAVALALALLALNGSEHALDRTELALLCARVENDWFGAHTGLLDQLTSLYGRAEEAVRIDFRTLAVEPVPLHLDGWRLATLDSGERRSNASSGYNQRRAECARACELLGVDSLRDTGYEQIERLPSPLRARARHVLSENERVDRAVDALRAGELSLLAGLLNESHESMRDDLDVSTPAVEATVAKMLGLGAAGARLLGGGFGGSVLGLFPPNVAIPDGAQEVRPCAGAHVLAKDPRQGPDGADARTDTPTDTPG